MTRSISHRLTLLAVAIGLTAPLTAQSGGVTAQLESWYAAARRSAPGTWGVVVANQDGAVIWSVNATEPMVPASTVKLLTTGFARTTLGAEARRPTRVIGTGGVDPATGTWKGRWALQLNGDPTLERADGSGPTLFELATQLRSIGIRQMTGPLALHTMVGEPTAAYPTAWHSRHRGRYFAPPVGPVTLNENLVVFTIAPGGSSGSTPIITSDAPRGVSSLVSIEARTINGSRNALVVRQRGGGWVVTGTIGTRAGARRYSYVAHRPVDVVEATWARALQDAGIEWNEGPSIGSPMPDHYRVLAEVASAPFDSIAHRVNTKSINIGAELMLLWGAGNELPTTALENHVKAVTGLTRGIHLVDGSGLSDNDRVSPIIFTTYLARFPNTAAGRDFPLLFPANGSGTLKSLATGLPGRGVVRAKTGTLGNSSTLVGYLGQQDGMLLVAAMYNGRSTSAARQAQWKLFRTLGADGVVIPSFAEMMADAALGED